ncbi:MAG: hypothetical protein A2481_00170 [Candidatus Yonathbacteria bacterium RIFOXYC2_FULL_47_9]|nr:MAG: hypothetical protein A2481_00170 [Candidatus Yonathbacteria bacterium RIFOXYC2_FULL_47_9]HAT68705.1 hypothetical protein [Candidatus Yonathbacteria bacterium]
MEQQTGSSEDFFNYWSNLAKTDPERFEKERKEAIEAVILEAPEHLHQRLRGLQWQIDMERSRASDPLSACVRLNKMMVDYVFSDEGLPRIASLFVEVREEFSHLESKLSSLAK